MHRLKTPDKFQFVKLVLHPLLETPPGPDGLAEASLRPDHASPPPWTPPDARIGRCVFKGESALSVRDKMSARSREARGDRRGVRVSVAVAGTTAGTPRAGGVRGMPRRTAGTSGAPRPCAPGPQPRVLCGDACHPGLGGGAQPVGFQSLLWLTSSGGRGGKLSP